MSILIIDVHDRFGRSIFLWTYKKLGRGETLLKKNVNVKKNNNKIEKEAIIIWRCCQMSN